MTKVETAISIIALFVLITLLGAAILVYMQANVSHQVTGNFTSFSQDSEATLELRGSIVAKATNFGDAIDEIVLHVSNGLGKGYVDMTPGVTLLRYVDADQIAIFGKGEFIVIGLGNADADTLVEPNEIYEVRLIDLESILDPDLTKNKSFTVEIKPLQGEVIHIIRRTPLTLARYNDLG